MLGGEHAPITNTKSTKTYFSLTYAVQFVSVVSLWVALVIQVRRVLPTALLRDRWSDR